MRRRDFLPVIVAPALWAQSNAVHRKGRIKQGVTRGVFAREMSLEDCCREAARLGIQGFDLIGPADWPLLSMILVWWIGEAAKGRRPGRLRALVQSLGFDPSPR